MKKVHIPTLVDMLQHLPDVPDGRSGKFSITHKIIPAGEPVQVASMRNAIFMGEQATTVSFAQPLKVRELKQAGQGTWMSDHPQEVWQMRHVIDACIDMDKVLVGGLGLGVVSHLLGELGWCKEVITVEKSKNIDELVSPHITKKSETIVADLFKFLKYTNEEWDLGFFDIWQPTGERVWSEYVVPLRRLARGKVKKVLCWNEKEMQGQLINALLPVAHCEDATGIPPYEVFRRIAQEEGIVTPTWSAMKWKVGDIDQFKKRMEAEQVGRENDDLVRLMEVYFDVSSSYWEGMFGKLWDTLNLSKPPKGKVKA